MTIAVLLPTAVIMHYGATGMTGAALTRESCLAAIVISDAITVFHGIIP
jgi:hypothetical protein